MLSPLVRSLPLLALLVALSPASALAHAALLASEPPALPEAAPTELRLSFSEPVELAFSSVTVTGPDGGEVELGPLSLDPADGKVLVVPLAAPLGSGIHTVEWTVVSGDGHKVSGSYTIAGAAQ